MATLSRSDELFILAAASEAHKSQVLMKHGCVAVINGTIMARGHNSHRSFSKDHFIYNTCSCHAEMATLRELYKNCATNSYGKYADAIKVARDNKYI